MAKGKTTSKTTTSNKPGRAKPLVAKAGYTPNSRRRYPNGGKVCK